MEVGARAMPSKYGPSPLAEHSRAVRTAGALLLLEVAPEAINYELRRQHRFTESQAAAVIREASRMITRRAPTAETPRSDAHP